MKKEINSKNENNNIVNHQTGGKENRIINVGGNYFKNPVINITVNLNINDITALQPGNIEELIQNLKTQLTTKLNLSEQTI